jgi:hypothetical protein
LEPYWDEYFSFQKKASDLHTITEKALRDEVEKEKVKEKPFVDSQQIIGKILTAFGQKYNFHRQFIEQFPDLNSNQILGMQLYRIMAEDDMIWVYLETQHKGHVFSHATYFIPKSDIRYRDLCAKTGAFNFN